MATHQALLVPAKFGAFSLQQRPTPLLAAGHLLVKVHSVGLNPVDWKIKELGLYSLPYPIVLGNDVAGTVEQVGAGVEGWQVGDRILYQCNLFDPDTQGFQHYTVIDAGLAAKIPAGMSFSAAATVPVGLASAAFALWGEAPLGLGVPQCFDGKPRASGPALVIGGAATVGQFTIQILRASGFSPIITYASGKHTDRLKRLGATHVVDRTTIAIDALHNAVKDITSEPLKLVYDAISTNDTQNAAYNDIVAKDGTLIIVLPDAVQKKVAGKSILHILASPFFGPAHREFGLNLWKHTTSLLETGIIVPLDYEELSGGLSGVPGGLDRLREDRVSGKKLVALPQETA